jgi:hypothetical protein
MQEFVSKLDSQTYAGCRVGEVRESDMDALF